MTDNASLASHLRRDLSIDQQLALKTAAARLQTEFADMFGVEWVLDDPAGLSIEQVRPIRDDIERRVRRLLTELHITPTS